MLDLLNCSAAPTRSAGAWDRGCSVCPMQQVCPAGVAGAACTPTGMRPAFMRRRVMAGEPLYRCGDRFHQLHALRSGTMKASVCLPDGREQVSGFHLAGDIVGFDGLGDGRHHATVVALEDTLTCAVDYQALMDLASAEPGVQQALHRLMSREITRGRWHLLQLGRMSALERLAAFLIDLSQRSLARGYSGREFQLRMSRRELGSYLGLTLETVSRSLTALRDMQHLEVANRHLRIKDLPRFLRTFEAQRAWP